MRGQPRVMHGFDFGMFAEELRYALRVFRVGAHAIRESLHSTQSQPRFKRRRHGTALALDGLDLFKQSAGFAEYEGTAKLQRTLIHGSCYRVIASHQNVARL